MEIINLLVKFQEAKFSDFEFGPDVDCESKYPRRTPSTDSTGITLDHPIADFENPPSQVTALLTGFKVWFEEGHERPLGSLEIRLKEPEEDDAVDTRYRIPVVFGLRDWSDCWDDRMGAEIYISVIGI